jgi:site-specific DNA-methyltransferase (adenine-specific)
MGRQPHKALTTDRWLDRFHCGDAAKLARKLPRNSIDTIVTSPPYFQQRDYGTEVQIGNERSPEEYVASLVEVFAAIRPAMKETGTAWIVLGDKYDRNRLLGMPWRFALALSDSDWILRSDCIWHKPNAMPSSVKTRPTTDHEYIFMFSVAADYFYDADAIREPHVTFSKDSKMLGGRKHFGRRGGTPEQGKNAGDMNLHDGRWDQAFHPLGRNKRTVWSIPLSKFREAHFAVFPPSLVETCLLATCPPGGVVLDPFSGAGTTAVVARELGRHFVGFDCSREYCRMARARLTKHSRKSKS